MRTAASADLAHVARTLGYETRFDILRLLRQGDATVSDLADRLALDQPRGSAHLAALRQARTCYDDLAGVAGVQLMDALLDRTWLVPRQHGRRTVYIVSPTGESALRERDVDLAGARRARRMFAFACVDWTERRPHLGG